MHVLLITPRVDRDHDVHGFIHRWIEVLSGIVDKVTIVTGYVGTTDLPGNVRVRSYGNERGLSKARRIAEFARHCTRFAVEAEIDAVFAHMIPDYVTASSPMFRSTGTPYLLWYAHGTADWHLRLAHQLVDRVVTPTAESFTLKSDKVEVVGHGIDTERFTPDGREVDRSRLLGVGRIDPIKRFDILVEAVGVLTDRGRDVSLRIVGSPSDDRSHYDAVRRRVARLDIDDRVDLQGSISHTEIIGEYRRAGAFLTASETGSLDKVELEAMSTGTPTVSCNRSYGQMIRETAIDPDVVTFRAGDPANLADRIEHLLDMDEQAYEELRQRSRAVVRADHDLERMMERIGRILSDLET